MDERLDTLREILPQAGRIALRHFKRVRPERKPDGSIVTAADLEIQAFLIDRLSERFPSYGVLAEEGGGGTAPELDSPCWVIDPIDGSAAFSVGFPVWGISVGLIEGSEPTVGAVYLPAIEEIYTGGAHEASCMNASPIEVDNTSHLNRESILFVPTNAHRKYRIDFPGKCRSMGSVAAHVAFTARGAGVGTILNSYLWDFAGAAAILLRAGGSMRTLSGKEVSFREMLRGGRKRVPETILASSPAHVDTLLPHISER